MGWVHHHLPIFIKKDPYSYLYKYSPSAPPCVRLTVFSIKCPFKKDSIIFSYHWDHSICKYQKQPSRGILRKRCSENMQKIYRRTPMPKCNFNKVALQLYCFAALLKSYFGMGVLL